MSDGDELAANQGGETSRLQQIFKKISELSAGNEDPNRITVGTRELAKFMRELYGKDAVEKARVLETRSANRSFAQLVRVTVEALEREEQRGAET